MAKGAPKGRAKPANSGRKKNSPNKMTKMERELLAQLSAETYQTFIGKLNEIEDPKDYCNIWLKLQEYVLPKLAHQEVKIDAESTDSLARLRELASREINTPNE